MAKTRVSLLVATKDRRNFIPQLIANIEHQNYPKQLIEVIVADDGNDSIGDLLPSDYIYIHYPSSTPLAKKRQDLKSI